MNAGRRKRIDALLDRLRDLTKEFQAILEEEQESFDNMPEGLQGSERGAVVEEAIEHLEQVVDALETADSECGTLT